MACHKILRGVSATPRTSLARADRPTGRARRWPCAAARDRDSAWRCGSGRGRLRPWGAVTGQRPPSRAPRGPPHCHRRGRSGPAWRRPRRLPQPEDGRALHLPRHVVRVRDLQEVGPDRDAIGEHGGEDRLLGGVGFIACRQGEQKARGVLGADRPEIASRGVGAPLPADVDPEIGDAPAALGERDADRPRVAGRVPFIVVVPIALDLAIVAIPLVAIPADHVAAVAVDAGLGGKAEPYAPIWSFRDALLQSLCGCAAREHEQPRTTHDAPRTCFHWLISSWRYCAARGLCDWPIQKMAFLRSSRSGSVFPIWKSLSSAASSRRCEYKRISWSRISRSFMLS